MDELSAAVFILECHDVMVPAKYTNIDSGLFILELLVKSNFWVSFYSSVVQMQLQSQIVLYFPLSSALPLPCANIYGNIDISDVRKRRN